MFTTPTPVGILRGLEMGHGTNGSIYSRIATRARKVQAALPRMHLVFNALRAFTFRTFLSLGGFVQQIYLLRLVVRQLLS